MRGGLMRVLTTVLLAAVMIDVAGAWERDFALQPIAKRPRLEVRYTDGSRTAFEIVAQTYNLVGELRKPHRLVDAATRAEWLSLIVEAADGTVYTSEQADPKSRINLYRRGPYFCEIHWLDVQVAAGEGRLAPLKGDLTLYCYPDKLLASLTLHGVEAFAAKAVRVEGLEKRAFAASAFAKGAKQTFAFPVFGETEPLPDAAFASLEAKVPMRYDAVKGCYRIGSLSTGGFQGHFYRHPNRYETVQFRVSNNSRPRTIYVCHENIGGDKGSVEGGVLLDKNGCPLPIVVQISKNFAGEKEEKFYNPKDTSFSETYFPLVLAPGETRTLTSLHLYQNWGNHMVKQFSSLGAWMDYFHSSTGVTETTCYVPFKFGGLPGVAIADFRAMSQSAFWAGQPQHDNIAGHSFLSYKTGDAWQYLTYRGTTYHSTGPNWMDIEFSYLSTDGKISATVRTFEFPQADELRNFIRVRCEALAPVTVKNAKENFRLLTVATWVQRLRYKHFAASGVEGRPLDFSRDHFGVRGVPLPAGSSFAALYGERKGSNAYVLRSWSARANGKAVGPAASVWCEKSGDTRLLLVPDADELTLRSGDVIEFDAFWLPYGPTDSAAVPRIESVRTGTKVADFPPQVRAANDTAEFTLRGGRDLVPVIVTGFSDYWGLHLYRKQAKEWRVVSHARVGDFDGQEIFVDNDGTFGAVFLVATDATSQVLRARRDKKTVPSKRIALQPLAVGPDGVDHAVLIQAPWMGAPIRLRFPETVATDTLDFIDHHRADMPPRVPSAQFAKVWDETEGNSLWFEWKFDNQTAGGRLSPNVDDVDLEFWLQNRRKSAVRLSLQFCPVLAGTMFADNKLTRTWIHTAGRWKRMADTDRGGGRRELCHYPVVGGPKITDAGQWGGSSETADIGVAAVTSKNGKYVFAIAWPRTRSLLSNADIPCAHADPTAWNCPPGRRAHLRGKLYLMEGTLDDLLARVRRDIPPQVAPWPPGVVPVD